MFFIRDGVFMIERTLAQAHSNRISRIVDALFLAAYSALIYALSAQPSLPAPMWFSWQDKLYHGGEYFVLGVLAWRCFRHFIRAAPTALLAGAAFCSLYGLSDEWHQAFVPGRTSSAADWLADTLGAVAATVGLRLLARAGRKSD
jgi:VanZ family protein